MTTGLDELEAQALHLSPEERGKLIHRLIVSLEGTPEDTPEAIAQAWDEEIARRVADMEAGNGLDTGGRSVRSSGRHYRKSPLIGAGFIQFRSAGRS